MMVSVLPGASWYVAPNGDDATAGSIEQPFATVQRAQNAAMPGDTVFIRGGTYLMQEAQIAERKGLFASITLLNKSGTKDQPIIYCAYKNERPVFDCSQVKPMGMRVSAFHVKGSWLRVVGLEVVGVQVTIKTHTQSICFESNGSHNRFERLSMHDGQAIGIYHMRGSDNLFLNCDAWNNWDNISEDGKGGNTDGFGCHPTQNSTGNVFRSCRAWFNSDDGFDCLGAHESVTFENCWAIYNGFSPKFERNGDGNGFKAGGYGRALADRLPKTIPRHTVRFCVAAGNKSSGFYANHHPGGCDWFNNTAYRNGTNFNMLGRLADNVTDVDGYGHKLRNNLSYHAHADLARCNAEKSDSANNSFTPGLKVDKKDFLSLDVNELLKPRKDNGELPDVSCLHLAPGSAHIDAGVDIGFTFNGVRPDLGAFER